MICPRCTQPVEETTDQAVALTTAGISGLVVAAPLGMFVAPYLVPVVLAGLLWGALRKVTCPFCRHRFTWFQEGKR